MGMTKQQREFLKSRVIKLLEKEPGLTNDRIMERFGCKLSYIEDLRSELGMKSPRTETLIDNDFEKSLVPKLLPKRRKKPHYINFGEKK